MPNQRCTMSTVLFFAAGWVIGCPALALSSCKESRTTSVSDIPGMFHDSPGATWVPFAFVATKLDPIVRGSFVVTATGVTRVVPDPAKPDQIDGYYVDGIVQETIYDTAQTFGWESAALFAGETSSSSSSSSSSTGGPTAQRTSVSMAVGTSHLFYVALGTQGTAPAVGGRYVVFPSLGWYRPSAPDGRPGIDVGFAGRVWEVDDRDQVHVEGWNEANGGLCEKFIMSKDALFPAMARLRQQSITAPSVAEWCRNKCKDGLTCFLGQQCAKVDFVVPREKCRNGSFFVDGEEADQAPNSAAPGPHR